MDFPKLFGLDKNGKEREWSIKVKGNTVIKSYGVTDGKLIVNERNFQGKNTGKKNETTDEEQAILVARRDWIAQIEEGYAPRGKSELYDNLIHQKAEQGGGIHNLEKVFDVKIGATKDAVKKAVSTKSKKVKSADNGIVAGFNGSKYKAMLTDKWEYAPKCEKYFDFKEGVYIQPKLDGIRCLVKYDPESDKVVFLSREGKQFVWLNHLRNAAYEVLRYTPDLILDCEIYASEVLGVMNIEENGKTKKITYETSTTEYLDKDAKFQFISGAVKTNRTEPHLLEGQLQLHVFDMVDLASGNGTDLIQKIRFKKLKKIFSCMSILPEDIKNKFVRVETQKIHSMDKIETIHTSYIDQGYEGVVLRAKDLKYQFGVRSKKIRKHKNFDDAEFKVIGIDRDPGVAKEYFTWLCLVDSNKPRSKVNEFSAKPIGNRVLREYWYDNYKDFIGKQLTVRFQGYLAEGKPRFPRGYAFREEGV